MTVKVAPSGPAIADPPDASLSGGGAQVARPVPGRGWCASLWFVATGLLVLLFAPRFQELARRWLDDPNYSHGFFVPVVSGLLALRWVRAVGLPRGGSEGRGLVWIVGGCVLHLVAVMVWFPPLDFLALASILHGVAILAGGREWARGLRFPILFLFFMFPLPLAVTEPVALWLQEVVSGFGTAVLQLFLPAYREGNFIYLPAQRLEVGEACSGLRQMMAFLSMALLIGHLSGRSWGHSLALLLAAVPLAVVANLLRLVLMAVVVEFAGPAWIGGVYHDLWGLLTLGVGVGLLLGVRWWLGRLVAAEEGERSAAGVVHRADSARASSPRIGYRPALALIACFVPALAIQVGLWAHVESAVSAAPVRLDRPLAAFPKTLGGWTSQDLPAEGPRNPLSPRKRVSPEGPRNPLSPRKRVSPEVAGYVNQADDKIHRLCTLQEGPLAGLGCQLWIIHFRDGRDRAHHPVICHEVAGYVPVASGRASISVEGQGSPVERFCFTRNGMTVYVFYWHYTLEPPPPTDQSLLQRIYQPRPVRWPSVTLEVFTTARDAASLDTAAAFVKLVDGQVKTHLPSYARMGSDLLPVRLIRE